MSHHDHLCQSGASTCAHASIFMLVYFGFFALFIIGLVTFAIRDGRKRKRAELDKVLDSALSSVLDSRAEGRRIEL